MHKLFKIHGIFTRKLCQTLAVESGNGICFYRRICYTLILILDQNLPNGFLPAKFMRFPSIAHSHKYFPVALSAVLWQVCVWLSVTANLILGNGATFDSRYTEQPELQMQIMQDDRLIGIGPNNNGVAQSTQLPQFNYPYATTQFSQTPYYSQNESSLQTESYSLGQNNNQKASVTDGRRSGMFQGATFGFSYLSDLGNHGLEMTQVRVGASFGLPAPMKNSFFVLSPSFDPTFVKWDGPEPFPDTLYSASLGCTLFKKFDERWTAMASVGPRWCSDGKETQSAVRCFLMGGMIWAKSSEWQFRFGVAYFDRNDSFNVIPFGGLIWTPNEDWKYELMAPMLRVSRRCHYFQQILPRQSESTHWGYSGIGFGGGTWAIESINKKPDVANYTEFSVVVGLESERMKRSAWKAEIGYVFGRSMNFEKDTMRKFNIGDSIVLRATLSL